MSKSKGLFITFEGPEGGGKSTQIQVFSQYLIAKNKEVIVTREPGGTKLGTSIRSILLDPHFTEIVDRTELLLFLADRAQHVKQIILPALESGKIVLCDRFIDSTYAYQVGGRGFSEKDINFFNDFSAYSLKPDFTFLLDVDFEVGIQRATKVASDRFENEKAEFHKKIRAKYLELYEANKQRFSYINTTNNSVEEISNQIIVQFEGRRVC